METEDEAGNKHVIFVAEYVPEGKTAPLEYCQERIREILLSARKHDLEEGLEKSLMEDALRSHTISDPALIISASGQAGLFCCYLPKALTGGIRKKGASGFLPKAPSYH